LTLGWYALVVGYLSHCVAHLYMWDETPVAVRAGGTTAIVLAVGVRMLIDRGNPAAALALTVLGAALALGLLAVHLPPYWGPFSQPWRSDVGLACWLTFAAAVAGGFVASATASQVVRAQGAIR
jgi:hypothetical protein